MRKDPLKWLFNTTTSGVIWHKRNIFFYWCSDFMMDTTKKYMYMHTDHWRPSIIHSSLNKGMNEWEIKKKDGTEGLLLLLDDIWVLFILFLTTFLVRSRTHFPVIWLILIFPSLTDTTQLFHFLSTYQEKLNDW